MQSLLNVIARMFKRFAVFGIVFLAVFSTPFVVPVFDVHVQAQPAVPNGDGVGPTPPAPTPPGQPTPTPPTTPPTQPDQGGGGGGQRNIDCADPGEIFANPVHCLGTWIEGLLTGLNMLLAFVLYVVGMIFDFTLLFSIHGEAQGAQGGGLYRSEAIDIAWNILRDIINLVLIFILLYVAIGTVLNIQSIDWRKQVAHIIIAAILVNFSLFLTRIVIDAGNVVALGFHQELTTVQGRTEPVKISERFMGILGIHTIRDIGAAGARMDPVTGGWAGAAIALLKIVVTLIAIWVFFAAAILFIGRTLALFLLLLLSPIGVAGSSIPLLGPHAQKWRETLFSQAFLPVVFLFLIFVVLLFFDRARGGILAAATGQLGFEGGSPLPVQTGTGAAAEGMFILYILVAAALIMTIKITRSISGEVGTMTNAALTTVGGAFAGGALGAGAFIGRNVVGKAAGAVLKGKFGERLKAGATSGGAAERMFSRMAFKTLDKAYTSDYDARNVKAFGVGDKLTKQLGKYGGVGRAKGGREEYEKRRDEALKKSVDDNRMYQHMSPEQLEKEAEKFEKRAKEAKWGPSRAVSEKRAKAIRAMMRKKETSPEEREKKVNATVEKLETANATDAARILKESKLKSREIASMPPSILEREEVILALKVGDLKKVQEEVPEETWNKIATVIERNPQASQEAKDFILPPAERSKKQVKRTADLIQSVTTSGGQKKVDQKRVDRVVKRVKRVLTSKEVAQLPPEVMVKVPDLVAGFDVDTLKKIKQSVPEDKWKEIATIVEKHPQASEASKNFVLPPVERSKKEIKSAVDAIQNAITIGEPGTAERVARVMGTLGSEQIVQLPPTVLKRKEVVVKLTVNHLMKIRDKMNSGDLEELVTIIKNDPDVNQSIKKFVTDPKNGFPKT